MAAQLTEVYEYKSLNRPRCNGLLLLKKYMPASSPFQSFTTIISLFYKSNLREFQTKTNKSILQKHYYTHAGAAKENKAAGVLWIHDAEFGIPVLRIWGVEEEEMTLT